MKREWRVFCFWEFKANFRGHTGWTAFVCTCCLLMKRISPCSHEPARPEPTLVLTATLYLQQIDHKSSMIFLKGSFQKHTHSKKSIMTCMVHSATPCHCWAAFVVLYPVLELKGRGFALFLPCFISLSLLTHTHTKTHMHTQSTNVSSPVLFHSELTF